MNIKIKLKSIIKNPDLEDSYIVFLSQESNNTLIYFKTNKVSAHNLLWAQSQRDFPRPHIHNTFIRAIKSLNAKILNCDIYLEKDEIYYAYLTIELNGDIVKIDTKVTDAISIAIINKSPILITKEILNRNGINLNDEENLFTTKNLKEETI